MEKFVPLINGFSYRHAALEGFLLGILGFDFVHFSSVLMFSMLASKIWLKEGCGVLGRLSHAIAVYV